MEKAKLKQEIVAYLYLVLGSLLFAVGDVVSRKFNWRRGEMFFFYLIWYSVGRFFIEGLRTDSLYLIGELRSAQVVSIIGIAIGIIAIVYRRMKVRPVVRYNDAK